MAKTTRATQFLEKAGVTFTTVTYDYDPNAERIGLRRRRRSARRRIAC